MVEEIGRNLGVLRYERKARVAKIPPKINMSSNLGTVLKTIETPPFCEEDNHSYNEQGACKECGLVNEYFEEFSNQGPRAYTKEESSKKNITEPFLRKFGPRTLVEPERDAYNNALPRGVKSLFNRLSKIQKSIVNSLERNYLEALRVFWAIKGNFSKLVRDTAWPIYIECAKRKLTMGRSILAFVGGSIYYAIRILGEPQLLFEVHSKLKEKTGLTEKELRGSLKIIYKERVLESLEEKLKKKGINVDYSIKKVKYIDYLNRYASKIGIPPKMIEEMAEIAEPLIDENGYVIKGYNPAGVIAANLYKGLKELEGRGSGALTGNILKKLKDEAIKQNQINPKTKSNSKTIFDSKTFTQAIIVEYIPVTEVTLRNRQKKCRKN